jgi:Tol biopolymer transport system component
VRRALAASLVGLLFALPAAGSTPGARILFEEPNGSRSDLVETDADATRYANLTPGDQTFYVSDSDGSWSPDGSQIAFTSHRDSNVSTEIYVMNVDGSNQERLTHDGPNGVQTPGAEVFDSAPVWSPAGDTIAYLKSVRGAVDVWLMGPDGSGQRQVTTSGGHKELLQWSAGGRLAYAQDGTIFTLVQGDPPIRVAAGREPAWSPDGSRLAYTSQGGLWTVDADGRNPVHVSTMPAQGPSWSSDGERIAFAGTRSFPELASPKFGAPTRQDVFTVRVDGGDLRRLTGPRGDEYAFGAWGGWSPTWWPDGSRLFFHSVRGGPLTWLMNTDGTCEGPFSQALISLQRPAWRPGSQPRLGTIRCADLRVALDASGGAIGPAALGEAHEFRFTIDNDGNETATGLRVEVASAAAEVAILDGSGGAYPCNGPPRDLVCSLPALAPASIRTVAFLVRSRRAGSFPFAISASAIEPDSDPTTNKVSTSAQVLPCDKVGTYGADVIYGTPQRDRICALPGADRVYGGGGNDYLDAGNGNDVVAGGPGRDVIVAKGGNDTVYARDGQRDVIDCGTERDVAVVDRRDVGRRCETVVRPSR